MLSIRRINEDDWAIWRTLRQAALAEAPEAFGSKLADWTGNGDREERWRARLSEVPFNVIALLDQQPAGMASGTTPEDGQVELISLWVAPMGRSQGVSDALVDAVVQWASTQHVQMVVLNVRQTNARAIAFYRKNGFKNDGWATGPGHPVPERRMVRHIPGAATLETKEWPLPFLLCSIPCPPTSSRCA